MAEIEEKGKREGGGRGWAEGGGWKEKGREERFGFQWASCEKKKRHQSVQCTVGVEVACTKWRCSGLGFPWPLAHACALFSINQP